MTHLITYCNELMTKSAELCKESSLRFGVDTARAWEEWLIQDFSNFNYKIFKQERGCGYWLWKPYIIYTSMRALPDNAILIYSDAGIEFINNVSHIIEKMDQDIFFFGNNYNHVDWCKQDVINAILPNIDEVEGSFIFTRLKQVQASVIFFRVNQKTKDFVKEWLLYCQMPGFIDDSPSKLPNYPTFAEHRHDQAILTCLQIKYGYKIHYWPSSYNNGAFTYDKLANYQQDKYPVIFHHHRKRNNEY